LTHLPFSERRPDYFCRGIGRAVHGSDLFVTHIVSDSRSRSFAAASGFSKCLVRAIRSGRFPWAEPAVTAVGFVLFQVCRRAMFGAAHAGSKFRVGHQPPEIRFRLLSARELGFVTCFEMRLTDTCRDAFMRITGPALQRIDAADAWLIQIASN
jgi:hypothetical protein